MCSGIERSPSGISSAYILEPSVERRETGGRERRYFFAASRKTGAVDSLAQMESDIARGSPPLPREYAYLSI